MLPTARRSSTPIYSPDQELHGHGPGPCRGGGRLTLEDRVLPYFPEVNPDGVCENGRKMRVRDLLAMASGHDQDTMDAFRQGGPEAYFALPVPYEPGTHFLYNTGNSNMLGLLVERVTGQSLYAYLKARVFDKIGIAIEDGDWERVRARARAASACTPRPWTFCALANLYLLRGPVAGRADPAGGMGGPRLQKEDRQRRRHRLLGRGLQLPVLDVRLRRRLPHRRARAASRRPSSPRRTWSSSSTPRCTARSRTMRRCSRASSCCPACTRTPCERTRRPWPG